MLKIRVGQGYDSHRFEAGRPLVLGGVRIPHERGLAGHSDADVLLHALTDAILGAAGLGDIGSHFPPTDEQWRDADSAELLAAVMGLARAEGWEVGNCDLTVVAEAPKIGPHRELIRRRTASILGCPVGDVSVKATTNERMGFVGREEGIAALAVVLLTGRGAGERGR